MYTFPQNIFELVRQEKDDFINNQIEVVPGYLFSQYETIKKIHKYYNSQYATSNYETINGVTRKRVFRNINKWRCTVAAKQLDVDVKDFVLISENPETEFNVALLEKEMKAWMKKSKLGKILNEIVRKLPIYGSVVLRKTKKGAEIVDLRYLFNDQSAQCLDESRYIILKHLMTPRDLRKMKDWDNTQEVIDKYLSYDSESYEQGGGMQQRQITPYAEVYERFGEVPLSWFTDKNADDNIFVLSRFIIAGCDEMKKNSEGKNYYDEGIILFKEQIKELPLKEVHYDRTEGRWLGIGVVEDTFEDQRRVNEIKDQEAKALEIASLVLFQTRDQLVHRNLLSDVDNGELLRVNSEITRIDNNLTSLPVFETVANDYDNHANKTTFSSDLLAGEAPASSATATAVINQTQQSTSTYDFKKENVGLFLNEFITDLVFPEIETKLNQPHIFRFTGEIYEIQKLRERSVEGYLRTKIFETGEVPTPEQYQMEKDRLLKDYTKQGNQIWLDVEKDFFRNLEYEVSLEVTGESRNLQTQLQNIQFVFGLISKNPQILDNPILKRLLFKVMSLMGMSLSELENAESEYKDQQDEMQQQQLEQQQMGRANQTRQQMMQTDMQRKQMEMENQIPQTTALNQMINEPQPAL